MIRRLMRRIFARHPLCDGSECSVMPDVATPDIVEPPTDVSMTEKVGERMHEQSHRLHVLQWKVNESTAVKQARDSEVTTYVQAPRQARPS